MPPIPKKTTPKPKAKAPAAKPGASGGRRAAAKSAGKAAAGSGAAAPAVLAGTYLKERHGQKKAVRTENREARDTGKRQARLSSQRAKGAGKGKSFLTRDLPRQALLGEFMLCVIVVIAGTVVAPAGSNNGATRMMIKLSGLSALFFILALVSAGGPGPAKAAGGLGALVTLSYVVSSSDAGVLTKWAASYFSQGGPASSAGPDVTQGAYLTGSAPAAAAPSGGGLTVEQGAT